ncbi:hypothetical protein ACHHYP_20816 [Achlya hypogyna]|uniref:Secreted protein n=1 Tax=Achlya hypogyna TaxID=1202772 RepID=A0A1V9Y8A7_ACHHY|nr:hypothetical protein ACHHYP_20816 [Achlya hypogyna]
MLRSLALAYTTAAVANALRSACGENPAPAPIVFTNNAHIYISDGSGNDLSGWSGLVNGLEYTGWDYLYLTKCTFCSPTPNGNLLGLTSAMSPTGSVWTYETVDSTHLILKDKDGLCLTKCPGCLPNFHPPRGDPVLTTTCANLPTQIWTIQYV